MSDHELAPDLINELEQYRRILNNIPAEIGVLDTDGCYLFNTPSGIRDAGVRKWMLGKTNHEWVRERGHPIEIADQRQAAVDHCVTEKESVTFEEIWTGPKYRELRRQLTHMELRDVCANCSVANMGRPDVKASFSHRAKIRKRRIPAV